MSPTNISTILVANRGEIARRVFRTAHAMGMRCVAVYVDADAGAPFVSDADVAVRLHGGYLDGEAIIASAKAAGAQAIHPGYGFLSENAAFARDVTAAGLIWVGPQPEVIEAMGDKLAAKQIAIEAGVPTLPSTDDLGADTDIGYPLLVKAAAGGGGRGMRVVQSAEDLSEAVAAAQREAMSGFGDDKVFLERYVSRARHVEIQILGDLHGGLVHLGERECSIQRRHQKIIEESPSPGINAQTRAAMGEAALALARAMNYQSTGTVEFLLDDSTGEFYFLEVNTRLQVEHPVTEQVTGLDLVREQLRVAAGEPLGYCQDDVSFNGHAVEARLYAEDPANGFVPAVGTLSAYQPAAEPAVRWDSGVEVGSVVGVEFDPMLGKVIAHASTRAEAAGRLALALERLHLGGVTTNRDFLAAVLRSEAFTAGDTTTDFIERLAPAREMELHADEIEQAAIVGALWLQGDNRNNAPVLGFMPSGFRVSRMPDESTVLTDNQHETSVAVRYRRHRDGSFRVNGRVARIHRWSRTEIDVDVDEIRSTARITRAGNMLYVQVPTGTVTFAIAPRFSPPGAEVSTGGLASPMPGTVLEVRCAVGDVVSAGQTLAVLEAMKMEHRMDAPADGVVAEVLISKGDQVAAGQVLVVFEDGGDSE